MEETTVSISITEAEIAEWRRTLGIDEVIEDPNAKTKQELMAFFRCGKKKLMARLEQALDKGTVCEVRVRRYSAKGRPYTVTAYQLVPPEEGG